MRALRLLAIALALVFAFAARAETAPADVVREMYKIAIKAAAGSGDGGYSDPAFRKKFFTASLSKLADAIDAEEAKTNEAILDFDPILDTNGDVAAENLAVRVLKSDARSAEVLATFGKGKDRRSVAYRLLKESDGWRIDEISSAPGAKGTDVWSIRSIYDVNMGAKKN